MYRLSYLLFQGFFLLASHEELTVLNNGALYKVDAIRSKFTCQDDFMYIKCLSPKVIKIFRATYSRKDDNICKGWTNAFNSAEYCTPVDKTRFLQKLCEGHTECNVAVDTDSMGNKCPNISALKYLNVIYNCVTLPPTTESPFVQNKSTMVLTKPSSPSPSFNHSTEDPTKITGRFFYTTIEDNEDEEDSTSAVYGFVIYNGGSVNRISGVLIALLLGIRFFL